MAVIGYVAGFTGSYFTDLIVGAAIGDYVVREALEILRGARERPVQE